jgi:outer membrane lipoprotein carrier protein
MRFLGRGASKPLAVLAVALSLPGVAALARAGDPEPAPAEAQRRSAPAAPEASDEACRKRAIGAVQRRYEGIRDLRARFVQTTSGATVGARAPVQTTSRGIVVVAKPSRMRWTYDAPEASVVVSDGQTLWIYDPGFGEVQRMPVGDGFLSGAALQFLLGRGEMEREFEVRLISCEADSVELELTPREPTSYEKVRIVADPRSGNVSRTRIDDLLGNVAEVAFTEIEVNLGPSADVFRFEPPAGVRVIDVGPTTP